MDSTEEVESGHCDVHVKYQNRKGKPGRGFQSSCRLSVRQSDIECGIFKQREAH
jgi:hypothetical protein